MKKFSAGSCRTGMFLALFSTLLLVSTDQSHADDALDWSHWRGPEMNGISREKGIVDTWNPAGKGQNVLWKSEDAGGRSTPIVMKGKLYTIVRNNPGTKNEGEKVVCLNAATGEKICEYAFNVFLSPGLD